MQSGRSRRRRRHLRIYMHSPPRRAAESVAVMTNCVIRLMAFSSHVYQLFVGSYKTDNVQFPSRRPRAQARSRPVTLAQDTRARCRSRDARGIKMDTRLHGGLKRRALMPKKRRNSCVRASQAPARVVTSALSQSRLIVPPGTPVFARAEKRSSEQEVLDRWTNTNE